MKLKWIQFRLFGWLYQVEVWEAVVTFLLFPILVYLAYLADKGFPWNKSRVSATTANGKQIELGSIQPGECKFFLWFPTCCWLLAPTTFFWPALYFINGSEQHDTTRWVEFNVPCWLSFSITTHVQLFRSPAGLMSACIFHTQKKRNIIFSRLWIYNSTTPFTHIHLSFQAFKARRSYLIGITYSWCADNFRKIYSWRVKQLSLKNLFKKTKRTSKLGFFILKAPFSVIECRFYFCTCCCSVVVYNTLRFLIWTEWYDEHWLN